MQQAMKNALAPAARVLDRLDIGMVRLLKPGSPKEDHAPARILVWTMDRIGDVQRATPLFRHLKATLPNAHLTCVVASRSAAILQNNPYIDALHRVPDSYQLLQHRRYIRDLKGSDFDMGLIAEVDPVWAKLGQMAFRQLRIPRWYGFDLGGASHPRETLIQLRHEAHWTEMFTRLAEAASGKAPAHDRTEIFLSEDDREAASGILRDYGIADKPFVLIHPGSGSLVVSRRWPPDRYGAVAKHIVEKWGIVPAITGTEPERGLTAECIRVVGPRAVDLTGKFDLRTLAALMERSSLVVTNDTGPLHIAVALQKPLVAILGPTSPQVVGLPPGRCTAVHAHLPCQPCAGLTGWKACTHVRPFFCLEAVSTAVVINAVDRELERQSVGLGSGPVSANTHT